MNIALLVLLGLGAGFSSGLLGIGGGVIYVPVLMYLAGIPIHSAIGISLALIVPSAAAGFVKHYWVGNVHLPTVYIIAPASIIGAVIGAYSSSALPADLLKKVFGICLIIIGVNTAFFGGQASMDSVAEEGSEGDVSTFPQDDVLPRDSDTEYTAAGGFSQDSAPRAEEERDHLT
ncbi:sulfite exporter TauE/SafE family protein [bacterium]|nr:sulfite exporter TauE/SafE family protein [bacterium]